MVCHTNREEIQINQMIIINYHNNSILTLISSMCELFLSETLNVFMGYDIFYVMKELL